MQRKLCILISSEYLTDTSSHADAAKWQLWNTEVARDLETVENTLTDHDVVQIKIPVLSNIQYCTRIVENALKAINESYETCHIVLNSHGASGRHDLKDDVVQMVVRDLSEKNIKITQLSSLQCYGMSALSAEEARTIPTMRLNGPKKQGARKASMEILKGKLNATITQGTQEFDIRGFDKAYDPILDQSEVMDVLRGTGGIALHVVTQAEAPPISLTQLFVLRRDLEVGEHPLVLSLEGRSPRFLSKLPLLPLVLFGGYTHS